MAQPVSPLARRLPVGGERVDLAFSAKQLHDALELVVLRFDDAWMRVIVDSCLVALRRRCRRRRVGGVRLPLRPPRKVLEDHIVEDPEPHHRRAVGVVQESRRRGVSGDEGVREGAPARAGPGPGLSPRG